MQFNLYTYHFYFYTLYAYIQLFNESEELFFHQVDLTFFDINYHEYMLQDGIKTCREVNISGEIDRKNSRLTMRDMKFYNCKLITRVYDNDNMQQTKQT